MGIIVQLLCILLSKRDEVVLLVRAYDRTCVCRVGEEKEKVAIQLEEEREDFGKKTTKLLDDHDSLLKERESTYHGYGVMY